jgi:hypothetical protein
MLRRLILGMVFGLIVGGAVAFGLVRLGELAFTSGGGEAIGYLSSAVAGALTGAIAGKPIWASGAKIEAGLKSFFGAVLAVGAMFALQRWGGGIKPELSALGGDGNIPIGELPLMSLPLISGVLGGLFGLDNTDEPDKGEPPRTRKRVAAADAKSGAKSRAADTGGEAVDDSEPTARRAKR